MHERNYIHSEPQWKNKPLYQEMKISALTLHIFTHIDRSTEALTTHKRKQFHTDIQFCLKARCPRVIFCNLFLDVMATYHIPIKFNVIVVILSTQEAWWRTLAVFKDTKSKLNWPLNKLFYLSNRRTDRIYADIPCPLDFEGWLHRLLHGLKFAAE